MYVPDLRAAEEHYVQLFGMTVLFREGRAGPEPSDAWATLPLDKGWTDADAAGVSLGMVALCRDDMVLALFAGRADGPQVLLGVLIGEKAIDAIAARVPAEALRSHRRGYLEFLDRYGILWQLSAQSAFLSAGDRSGRWIDLGRS